jgi:hypothetical protein
MTRWCSNWSRGLSTCHLPITCGTTGTCFFEHISTKICPGMAWPCDLSSRAWRNSTSKKAKHLTPFHHIFFSCPELEERAKAWLDYVL